MKLATTTLMQWAAALAFVVSAPLAQANLVKNPGFECGDTTCSTTPELTAVVEDWSVSEGFPAISLGPVHSDFFSIALLYDSLGLQSITQMLSGLTVGATYEISYWLNYLLPTSGVPHVGDFAASVGMNDVFTGLTGVGPSDGSDGSTGWFQFQDSFVAGATDALLSFSVTGSTLDANCPSAGNPRGCSLFIDDVSVTQAAVVPEPGTLLLVGAALAATALVRRRKTAV